MCYSPSLRRLFVSMDAMFVESKSYFSKSSLQGEILSEQESSNDLDLTIDTPTPTPLLNIEPNDTPILLRNIELGHILPPIEHDKNLNSGI